VSDAASPSRKSGDKAVVSRESRFSSHALLDVRRYKFLPFGVHSAVLLDISAGGFKVEFTGETRQKPGDQFWVAIPLGPLGIFAPPRLMCRGECRWFDDKKYRMGGVFLEVTETDRHIIDQVIDTLQKRGALPV
jgi:hypothetical protein